MRVLLSLLLLTSLTALGQSGDVRKYLNVATTLYKSLDYEKSLKQLARAHEKSKGPEDDAAIALLEGVVLAQLGRKDDALEAFKIAFSIDPDAKLPVKVGTKQEALANKARESVKKALSDQLEQQRRQVAEAAAAEARRQAEEDAARKASEAKAVEQPKVSTVVAPVVVAKGEGTTRSISRPLAWASLGLGTAAGIGATVCLLSAKSKYDALVNHSSTVTTANAAAFRDDGRTLATVGTVLAAVASAAMLSTIGFFVFGSSPEQGLTLFGAPHQAGLLAWLSW